MAEVRGCNGSVTFTNLNAGAKSWTLDYTSEVLETTDFGDNCSRTYIAGFKGWTATVECNWDATNTVAPGDSATLTLDVDGTHNYSGTALVTGASYTVPVDGLATATFTFQGTGDLTTT